MLKKALMFLAIALNILFFSTLVVAQAPTAADVPTAAVEPLTVVDVIIDKTAKNAVVARDDAIVEARRVAFQKLAERNMDAEDYKSFKLPSDQTIATMVQDFEIKNEQLSATRYVANFTVRFREVVRNYVHVRAVEPQPVATEEAGNVSVNENTVDAESAAAQPAASSTVIEALRADAPVEDEQTKNPVLLLPYYENIAGKTFLFDDPNPWRQAWQNMDTKQLAGKRQIIVPLGDINDVSAGSSEAVWSGKYDAVEKLRRNYGVEEVILAVANKSGTMMSIDLYSFKNDKLQRLQSVTPFVGDKDDATAFAMAVDSVKAAIYKPTMFRLPGTMRSREETPEEAVPESTDRAVENTVPDSTPGSAFQSANTGNAEVDAMMSFSSFSSWIEAQKRLASVVPAVRLTIKSISHSDAQFSMGFAGNVDTFKVALSEHGLALGDPTVEVSDAVLGSAAPTQKSVYELRLVN